jgi:hypothetical protein
MMTFRVQFKPFVLNGGWPPGWPSTPATGGLTPGLAVEEQLPDSKVSCLCSGKLTMAHDNEDHARPETHDALARSVAKETGISEEQARELIGLIGTDRIPCSAKRDCFVSVRGKGRTAPKLHMSVPFPPM